MKLATFTWSYTIEVPDDFNEENNDQFVEAFQNAWNNVQKSDGELTDLRDRD